MPGVPCQVEKYTRRNLDSPLKSLFAQATDGKLKGAASCRIKILVALFIPKHERLVEPVDLSGARNTNHPAFSDAKPFRKPVQSLGDVTPGKPFTDERVDLLERNFRVNHRAARQRILWIDRKDAFLGGTEDASGAPGSDLPDKALADATDFVNRVAAHAIF